MILDNTDYDSYFHMIYNVYELHEYDVDIQHNEQPQIKENVAYEYFPIFIHIYIYTNNKL